MEDIKPGIFIGSSTPGLPTAERIAKELADVAECELWTHAFELGIATYEQLTKITAVFDYGILLATADDPMISKNAYFESPRDNVLLEFGLFAGALGRGRAIFVREEEAKEPADLFGITMPRIKKPDHPEYETSIKNCCDSIKKHIAAREKVFDLGMIPSTVLAYGYFKNFIERCIARLFEDRKSGKQFTLPDGRPFNIGEIKMTIFIPDDLTEDMFDKVKAKRLMLGWEKLKVDPKETRDYDFHINIDKGKDGLLHVVDIPLTLNALHESINTFSQKGHIGYTAREKFLERKELRNFRNTIVHLINHHAITKGVVVTEIIDI